MSHYGAIAGKASIAFGDLRRANEIISAALPLDPSNPELNFLQRVISRQRTLMDLAQADSR